MDKWNIGYEGDNIHIVIPRQQASDLLYALTLGLGGNTAAPVVKLQPVKSPAGTGAATSYGAATGKAGGKEGSKGGGKSGGKGGGKGGGKSGGKTAAKPGKPTVGKK